jgi:2-hydroxychromene-2-carboxylate isomerase
VDAPEQPVFYYDLGSPGCYIAAERMMSELPAMPEWEPVHGAALGIAAPAVDESELAAAIARAELQPLRLPAAWPPDTERAMLAATYAKHIGRAVAFSLAAFRQAFAGGRDLGDEGTMLIAAAACEMHPTAVLRSLSLRSVTAGLVAANARAAAAGVRELPAIEVAGTVVSGPDCLTRAAQALAAMP